MEFDAIIVGGGLGGLSAGAILARQGRKVLLLEQHYIPGGCATTFKRREFLMEVGLHAMDGHLIDETRGRSILRHLGVRKLVEFKPLPEFFQIKNKYIDFTFPLGTETAVDALLNAFPEEEKGIRRFFKTIMGVQDELIRIPKQRWVQILMQPLFPFLYPETFTSNRFTVGRFLDRYIGNDTLKVILQGNMLYYHDDPYTMSLAFFAKAQASFIHLGSFFIKGGSQKLSDALAAVIRSNGGTVLLAKQVAKVLIRKGRAVGVIFRDAFNAYLPSVEARADFIIYNGAAPLLPGLLEGRPKDRLQKKIAGLKPSLSLFCIHLGFKEAISGRINHHYSTFIYGDEVQAIGNIRPNYYADWKERGFVFVDYSQIDSGLAPDGKGFGMICAADRLSDWEELEEQSYKTRKEEVARILIGRLDQAFPGIAEKIEYYQVGTPRTIRRYTLNPAGAPYGYAQIIGQTGAGRLSHRSPVRNLMLAGAWTSPGGGFTGSVISGFLCGLEVNKKLMANKQEREDDHFTDPRVVKLLKRELIARNTMELTFEKPEGFVFDPGQYAILSLNLPAFTDLDMPFRSLSMATHPGEKVLKFLMRRGESSFKRSCEALKDGDKVTVYGPAGSFTLRDQIEGVVFLASGIGISPVVSMIKELIIQRYSHPLFLFYSCPTESDAAYHRFLRQIELPKYRYIPVFSRNQGRITEGMLVKELKEPEVLTYFLVGAAGFVTGMASLLHALRVPPGSILTDDFG